MVSNEKSIAAFVFMAKILLAVLVIRLALLIGAFVYAAFTL